MFARSYFTGRYFAPSYYPPVIVTDVGRSGGYLRVRKRVARKIGHAKVAEVIARVVHDDVDLVVPQVHARMKAELDALNIRVKPAYADALNTELRRARRERDVSDDLSDDEAMILMALLD